MIRCCDLTASPWGFSISKVKPDISATLSDTISLPFTVSEAQKAPLTDERSDGYLTDPRRFEGYVLCERDIKIDAADDERAFLVMERTRTSTVYINGKLIGSQNSLCTPHRYDITEFAGNGEVKLTVVIDNVSCPVPGGHMTSQDTQTNWLGILGRICIEYAGAVRAENVRIYTDPETMTARVTGNVTGSGRVEAFCDGFGSASADVSGGSFDIAVNMDGASLWSEHDPKMYTMNISCGKDKVTVPFGMRKFTAKGTEFRLNGDKIFLRGKHDGMIFPLTGYAPMDKESWLRVMSTAKAHGINHYRFHTCCPPEAAFEAADELGIYMEPELPFWGTVEDEITSSQQYLTDEGFRILDSFGNHPSFFAMSLGNELWGSKERLNSILGGYKAYDDRHLYTQGSNNFQFWPVIVENDDFFVGVRFSKERLFRGSYAMCDAPLGHIQTDAPNSSYTYDANIRPASVSSSESSGGTIEIQYGTGVKTVNIDSGSGEFVSDIPVVSHEVGQYFMYPDYNEIKKYTGVLKPYNFEIFRERLRAAGLADLADDYFRASGRFAAECYKAEIETALRSKELSGFQLLDIQDFTGQGTALVGILNAFMESKGVISPEEWRCFCSDKVILGCLPKFVFEAGEKVFMPVKLYTYTGKADTDPEVKISLRCGGECANFSISAKGSFKNNVFDLGSCEITMPSPEKACRAVMELSACGVRNTYDLWIFPEEKADFPPAERSWAAAKEKLAKGESVFFCPERINEERSVEGTYCTDFWNYPMFDSISVSMNKPRPVGTLGLLIDKAHPALSGFPTEIYSTPQWYDIVTGSRTAILDGLGITSIVRTIDNCGRNHDLGTVFEVCTGGGKLLVCTSPLYEKTSLPCQRLAASLWEYVRSDSFAPVQSADIKILDGIFG